MTLRDDLHNLHILFSGYITNLTHFFEKMIKNMIVQRFANFPFSTNNGGVGVTPCSKRTYVNKFFSNFLAVVLVGMLSTVNAQDASTPVDPAIELGIQQAVAAFNNSDFDGAKEHLQTLYANFPNLAPPRIVLAQWFAQANLGEAVRASLEMATIETPNDPKWTSIP